MHLYILNKRAQSCSIVSHPINSAKACPVSVKHSIKIGNIKKEKEVLLDWIIGFILYFSFEFVCTFKFYISGLVKKVVGFDIISV